MTDATHLREDFEALMPEPAAFRMRYRSEPGMIGHYPWTYSDPRRRLFDRPKCEYEDLYTADQMREAIRAATERAAKVCDQQAKDHELFKNTQAVIGCDGCAAAIRRGQHGN